MEPSQISNLVEIASWYLTIGFFLGLVITGYMQGAKKLSGVFDSVLVFLVMIILWMPIVLLAIGYELGKEQ